MEKLQARSMASIPIIALSPMRGIVWGSLAGLAGTVAMDGNAFDEKFNKFNRSMNRGFKLSRWFTKEFGSTQCREITQCIFSESQDVDKFMEMGCLTHCREIAEKVADRVQKMLAP